MGRMLTGSEFLHSSGLPWLIQSSARKEDQPKHRQQPVVFDDFFCGFHRRAE
jgi:hypothetical protein